MGRWLGPPPEPGCLVVGTRGPELPGFELTDPVGPTPFTAAGCEGWVRGGWITVTVELTCTGPICAVTGVLPGPTAVTTPVELTVATAASPVVHRTPDKIRADAGPPVESWPLKASCAAEPRARLTVLGLTLSERSVRAVGAAET